MSIIVGKGKTGSLALVLIVRLHRILQSACLPDDGYRSIAEAHQLAEPTGFKQRWHQESIAGSIYFVGAFIGIEYISRHPLWIFPCKMPEKVFIFFFSGSQNHKLGILRTDLLDHIVNKVKSLLVGEPGHDTDHKLFIILGKSQFFLERPFVLNLFFAEGSGIVVRRDHRIRGRIVFIVVQSIYDSRKAACLSIDQAIQFFSIKWCLDLFSVCIADGSNLVRVHNSALQIIGIPICLQFIRCEIISVQSGGIHHRFLVPDPLEF